MAAGAARQGGKAGKGKRRVKPVTAARLERVALAYLEKYAATAEGVRRVLRRRVTKAARFHDTDVDAAHSWIEEIIGRLVRAGMIDDAAYAEGRVRSLQRQGRSRRWIAGTLAAKGVPADIAAAALAAVHGDDREFAAACRFARRRRLGPFRTRDGGDRARDLASLGRAGFSYGVARRVIETADAADLEAIINAASE